MRLKTPKVIFLLSLTAILTTSGLPNLMRSQAHAKSHGTSSVTSTSVVPGSGNAAVLTQHNDIARTGANLGETTLNSSNVNSSQFGKLFSRSVDGCIYAQPLYVPGVTLPQSGVHNVIYVATEHDTVYAFDADDPAATSPFWQVSLGVPVPSSDISPTYGDLTPEIGITSTPVIDLATTTLYVVAKSKDDVAYHQRLHALDIATGMEKFNGPSEIAASFEGTGDDNVNGLMTFNPLLQLNRPGLLLMNGVIYIAFGSHGDTDPYHGWVLGYDAATLQQLFVFNTTPDGGRGSVWQSGQGLAGDEGGNLYLVTANGTCDTNWDCGRNLGESVVKLTRNLNAVDWFTPNDRGDLDVEDLDFGSGGPILLPGTNYIAAGGKDGILRLLDSNNMGKFNHDQNLDLQEFQAVAHSILGAPVYWNSPATGPTIYIWGDGDTLKAYQLAGSAFQTVPISKSGEQTPAGTSNTAPLSISANGSEPGTCIIWASCPISGDANQGSVPGILRAYDASDLSVELWDSNQNQEFDGAGGFAKFCPPTVAGGKVYLASLTGALSVYGLLSSVCSPSVSPSSESFPSAGGEGTVNVRASFDCPWTAASTNGFITIQSGDNGNGTGLVSFSVAQNTGPSRTGTISVADQIVSVWQDTGCTYSINEQKAKFKSSGGVGSIQVSTVSDCLWTAGSGVDWISITSGRIGKGTGIVTYSVAQNKSSSSRTATLTVASNSFLVVQKARSQ
jgi:hypothetical protein